MLILPSITIPSAHAAHRVAGPPHCFRVAPDAASLCPGLYFARQAGVVNGLFTRSPRWTPE